MSPTINLSPENGEWISTAETAKALGKSQRTIQKMAKEGFLKWKLAGLREQPRQRVYSAKDVERIAAGAVPRPPRSETNTPALVRTARPSAPDAMSILIQMLAGQHAEKDAEREREKNLLAEQRQRWEVELKRQDEAQQRLDEEKKRKLELERPWLTIEHAMELSGLTKKQLVELAKSHTIVALQQGGWRINRASLELTFSAVAMAQPPTKVKTRGARA